MSRGRSATVDRVVGGQLCTGCGLCASVSGGAIVMDGASGFNRPVQVGDVGPDSERVIARTCPGVAVAPWPQAPHMNPYWGPWLRVGVGWSTDPAMRHQGSSGAAVTALAAHALKSGLVDRVVHVVADPANPTGNMVTCSTTEAEVVAGAGSRYAASSPLAGIDALLGDGGSIAFVGKPCDVSALRRLARIDPRVDRHVPLTLAFFCAGVPNQSAARRILKAMDMSPEEVTAFRYRGQGWPGDAVAVARDGRTARMTYAESWGQYLAKEVQFRCKICPDAVGGTADISCADAWYGDEAGYPSFEERDGRSLVLTRTARGDRFLDEAIAARALEVEALDIGEIDRMQPSQAQRKRLVRARTAALAATLQPRLDTRGTMVEAAAAQAGLKVQIRNFLGTVRRIVAGRR
ncbi:MAG TPA: Coenzyme F420 hydrogenase/dehydrogenase, beta subunit C-terminal domain [Phenylobacterium sp.]|nr:Coenzyme F420 hydrogenase/dehydrogenase, beta subunit C-terminal domain [Phenylobacterium sp.]